MFSIELRYVMSSITASRRREFGIRVALGADRPRMMRLVLTQGIRFTALGLVLGVGGTLAAAPLLQKLPISVRPPDFALTGLVAALIGVVGLVAGLVPAHRASGADPMTVLRND